MFPTPLHISALFIYVSFIFVFYIYIYIYIRYANNHTYIYIVDSELLLNIDIFITSLFTRIFIQTFTVSVD